MKKNIELFGSFFDPAKDGIALGQLGAAAVLYWDILPDDAKNLLLESAETISGIATVPDARHRLLDMVARNRPQRG